METQPVRNPFDVSDMYYYADGEPITLQLSVEWIAVGFIEGEMEHKVLENVVALIGAHDGAVQVLHSDVVLVPMQLGASVFDVERSINVLRSAAVDGLAFANPVFNIDGTQLVLTNEFIAVFPSGTSSIEIDRINSLNQVELVQPLVGQPNTFVLRVLPTALIDALTMANYYQEELGVSAAPNFLRLQPGPRP